MKGNRKDHIRVRRQRKTNYDTKLTECVKNIKDWMTSNFLLLNSDKTEILLIGPKDSTQNLLDYNLQLDGCNVTSSTVKNLGVILDSNLSFENHISNVTKTAFFHLRNISKATEHVNPYVLLGTFSSTKGCC